MQIVLICYSTLAKQTNIIAPFFERAWRDELLYYTHLVCARCNLFVLIVRL